MTETATYSVVLSGDLKSGFDADSVIEAFAKLFKLSPEKAGAIVGSHTVLKREVDLKVAKAYQQRLAEIGLDVKLKRHGGIDELALEPVVEPGSVPADDAEPLDPGEMICPKCELRQAKADECSGCGVIVQKYLQRQAETAEAATVAQPASQPAAAGAGEDEPAEVTVHEEVPLSLNWLIAPAVVAVLGALLWYLVAAKFGYEFGAIAWLIGGAVGFAAVSSGAQGHTIGVICGVLVLASICAGKYMTVSSEQDDLAQMLSASLEYEGLDLRDIYEQEIADASAFLQLAEGEDNLRRFMVDNEYSDFTEPSEVTYEEIAIFREYSQPRLEEIGLNRPSFEDWQQHSLVNAIEDLPTFDIMVDSLDWKDMLFLLFGIGTAFQLASRGRAFGS